MESIGNWLGLSRISLGTMRFQDKCLSKAAVQEIIESCFEKGISTHHSSHEYNSYSLYAESLRGSSCRAHVKHIVKLSSPHFEDNEFSGGQLTKHVDRELKSLGVDCIDVLQWLVRSKPINDIDRLATLADQREEMEECFSKLKQSGKIKSVFSFPYSVSFARQVIGLHGVDGVIAYLNRNETQYAPLANEHPFIAIRPLNAGRLVGSQNPEQDIFDCVRFVERHRHCLTQIASINSPQQTTAWAG
ncbi:aldo/keto reductase [Allorhodopirellula solitaria]|uniref:Aldo/keto reductase family protein n=1 Tax=Allorhodopirellula solitaria TaxID=2527987 RepID=A0A5C5XTZ6_9BACT|nr:aldo/keto reductase [Allorhodopirellula solitaria]TWT65052.1 Aldo/keto reductase family protein [Allorhodopirellula solitaria]